MASQPPRMMNYITFDVFTKTHFAGNPLAIVKIPPSVTLTQEEKQKIAREFNYSETVILEENDQALRAVQDPANNVNTPQWKIGIFLTTAEIPFAGHPTIGTTCYLGAQIHAAAARGVSESSTEPAIKGTVISKARPIPFIYDPGSQTSSITVPQDFHRHEKVLTVEEARFHGLAPEVIQNMIHPPPFVSLVKGMTFILVELPSVETLSKVRAGLKDVDVDGGQLDATWHPDKTFTAFVFFVRLGKDPDGSIKLRTRVVFGATEDPATGAASCTLVNYLSLFHPEKESEVRTLKYEV